MRSRVRIASIALLAGSAMSAQEYFDFARGKQYIDVLGQQLSPLPVRFSDGYWRAVDRVAAIDSARNHYIADSGSMRIGKVGVSGPITTVVGLKKITIPCMYRNLV
jgi:hypothetical protein